MAVETKNEQEENQEEQVPVNPKKVIETVPKELKKQIHLISQGGHDIANTHTEELVELINGFVLEKFYINRSEDYMEELKEELFCEQAQIYRIKDTALKKYTLSFFGITDY